MYKVLCDNALMCDSRIEELALLNPVVKPEENKAGSFSFKIPPKHPYYDVIQKRKTIVDVYRDEELIFSGMCIEATTDFYNQKEIYCEGELTYFNDSIQRPARYQKMTVRGLLETYIAIHNSQVEKSKQFQVGIVTVTDPNDSLSCYTNMESTMVCLKKDLVDDLGGFFRIRHEDDIRYIDYLADSPYTSTQVVKLGKNLLDFKSNIDSTDIATAIIPLGAKLEESAVEGLETRLTIESVNNGKDYVYSEDAVASYGWIYKTITFDNVTTASALKTKGEKYLAETQFENMVIEAKAIDLHFTDKSIDRFKISDQIRVVSAPHGLNKYFRLTKQTLHLNNPEKDTITLGKDERLTLSAKSSQVSAEIQKAIENIVPAGTIIERAVANATALISNAMGGYVVKTNDELLIMDTDNIETATKVWRWNINGLGYSSTGYDGEYALAMTMDGSIVADFIKAGVLTGIEINNGSGTFSVDSAGKVVANSFTASNASINGTFESKGDYSDSIKITNGNLKVITKGVETLNIVQTRSMNEDTVSLNFVNSNYELGTGMTSINGMSAMFPDLIVGTGASYSNDVFSCSRNAHIYGQLHCYDLLYCHANVIMYGSILNSSGDIVVSDRNKKNSIETLDEKESVDFINSLKPCKYKYNDGTSDRYHHGFIAQEVKESMGDDDWGVYIDGEHGKGLRYEELIADLVATVQNLNKRIIELEGGK